MDEQCRRNELQCGTTSCYHNICSFKISVSRISSCRIIFSSEKKLIRTGLHKTVDICYSYLLAGGCRILTVQAVSITRGASGSKNALLRQKHNHAAEILQIMNIIGFHTPPPPPHTHARAHARVKPCLQVMVNACAVVDIEIRWDDRGRRPYFV